MMEASTKSYEKRDNIFSQQDLMPGVKPLIWFSISYEHISTCNT